MRESTGFHTLGDGVSRYRRRGRCTVEDRVATILGPLLCLKNWKIHFSET
jgi:hypothetical protein